MKRARCAWHAQFPVSSVMTDQLYEIIMTRNCTSPTLLSRKRANVACRAETLTILMPAVTVYRISIIPVHSKCGKELQPDYYSGPGVRGSAVVSRANSVFDSFIVTPTLRSSDDDSQAHDFDRFGERLRQAYRHSIRVLRTGSI